MTSNITNQVAYLRTTREFPDQPYELSVEINKAYVDTSAAVNVRTIGIHPVNKAAITGESFYLVNNQKQQTLRQVYTFTTTAAITHGIKFVVAGQFTKCTGSYTDGTNTYGLFFATSVAIAGQITFYVTATQIIIVVGGGAPALTSGRIILEWLSDN